MPLPQAYQPEDGYRYQILVRFGNNAYEHCDYATHKQDREMLLDNYDLAYQGSGAKFKVIQLPPKFWPKALKYDDGTIVLLNDFLHTNTKAADVEHITPEQAEEVKNLYLSQSISIHPFIIKRIQ